MCIRDSQWAISTPVQTQSRVPIFQRASGFGIEGVQVDGNDVVATHAAVSYTHLDVYKRQTPSSTPVTGLSRPMSPTVPAGKCLSPANQQRKAIAVATTDTAA